MTAPHSKNAMNWGTVELEPEVTRWLEGLSDEDFGRAAFYVDLLEREGVHLGEPRTRGSYAASSGSCASISAGSGSG